MNKHADKLNAGCGCLSLIPVLIAFVLVMTGQIDGILEGLAVLFVLVFFQLLAGFFFGAFD